MMAAYRYYRPRYRRWHSGGTVPKPVLIGGAVAVLIAAGGAPTTSAITTTATPRPRPARRGPRLPAPTGSWATPWPPAPLELASLAGVLPELAVDPRVRLVHERAEPVVGCDRHPQLLPSAHAIPAGWGKAAIQIRWGLDYIAATYITPCSAWAHETSDGWY